MADASLFGQRTSGVLLHLTSLPGPHGSGDLSDEALRFVDQLAASGQSWWQMLPIGPAGAAPGFSPYETSSTRSGSPDLISLSALAADGLLKPADLRPDEPFDDRRVDFERVGPFRLAALREAFARLPASPLPLRRQHQQFCRTQRAWLDDDALYAALKHHHDDLPWFKWPKPLRDRDAGSLARARVDLADEIAFARFVQFCFDRQWTRLHQHAKARGVRLVGDLPIFVSHDSADVWCNPQLWQLDASRMPTKVSGAPPDAYSEDGQRWGHPLYNWKAHEKEKYRWWIGRFAAILARFDAVRIDHFIGFANLWTIPADQSAKKGKWVDTPGFPLLTAVQRKLGKLPIIVEDLGVVTKKVTDLRDRFGWPGMRVMQFGFGGEGNDSFHRPHGMPPHSVAYPGTHDNDTLLGFIKQLRRTPAFSRLLDYTGSDGRELNWDMLRTLFACPANTVITPLQDVIGLDDKARMNTPSTIEGNWRWRYRRGDFSAALVRRLREMTDLFNRTSEAAAKI